ncbi:hypothetical protein QTA56_13235 [Acinetobacter sp. VNH17]|uniref:Lipoprotein n=1 Tax=Acinetobacter thutiue TaxID=2998078 RepID=A0ABT7WR75_9GAMM|nr:hypothetical protein [Acinetobacter thutiue]MCY6413082.1 hypothetical protein [Acinetobacter thutiue]MDN0015191.1 hypothetical protein [Acinetobacter thutiue]
MQKSKLFLLTITLLLQGSCMQKREPPYIPQEGEVVTWKQNDHLIIKAKLGERRKHIINEHCKKCERDFYKPHLEYYIGQFSIDYVPEKFDTISIAEAKSLSMPYVDGQLEFDLMLNRSTVQATDRSPFSLRTNTLDHIDQVKVFVANFGINDLKQNINTKQFFESNYINKLDSNPSFKKYNLDCYSDKNFSGWENCFGKSKNKMISGFYFNISPNEDSVILGRSYELIYGGIKINWFTNQKNIDHVKDIDAAIWRLLDAWNVSPIKNINAINED